MAGSQTRFHKSQNLRSASLRCPLVQLALEVKYPPVRHLDARERRAGIHQRPPSDQPCRVLTGPLRPADGFPALPGGALLPRLLRALRHAPTATADGAPAPNPPTGLGGHRRDASHVHSYAGRQGRRPAVPRGHRRAPPQPGTRPRPPDRKTSGQDGPEQQPGPSTPTTHSRQFRGCCPVSGLQPLVRFPYAFLPRYRTRPAGGGPLLDVEGRLPPNAAPPASVLPSSFTRPLRRPGAGPLTPPGHMAPRGAVAGADDHQERPLVSRSRLLRHMDAEEPSRASRRPGQGAQTCFRGAACLIAAPATHLSCARKQEHGAHSLCEAALDNREPSGSSPEQTTLAGYPSTWRNAPLAALRWAQSSCTESVGSDQ